MYPSLARPIAGRHPTDRTLPASFGSKHTAGSAVPAPFAFPLCGGAALEHAASGHRGGRATFAAPGCHDALLPPTLLSPGQSVLDAGQTLLLSTLPHVSPRKKRRPQISSANRLKNLWTFSFHAEIASMTPWRRIPRNSTQKLL
jgi:hypothetical protein